MIVDNGVAHIVKSIFKWYLSGMGVCRITQRLNRINILSPGDYKRQSSIYNSTSRKSALWYTSKVREILSNKAYIGALDQKRKTTRNYRNRKIIYLNEEDHIIVYDTHEPIVEKHIFYAVQEMLKNKGKRTSPKKTKTLSVFRIHALHRLRLCYDT